MVDRVILMLMPVKHHPDVSYTRKVRIKCPKLYRVFILVLCVLALYTQYFPKFCEKITGILLVLGFNTTPFAILEQCITN